MTDNKKQIVKLTAEELDDIRDKAAKANDALYLLWDTLNSLEGWHCTPRIAFDFGSAYRMVTDMSASSPLMYSVVNGLILSIEDAQRYHGKV